MQIFSRSSAAIAVVFFLLFDLLDFKLPIGFQITLALIGLAIGIPHGAIDHLISIPRKPYSRFFLYLVLYVAIAVVAGCAIATWNVVAFNLVLIMSGLHFGFGDASFLSEQQNLRGKTTDPFWVKSLYALPAGFLPVLLPLTDERSRSALERIRPSLIDWAGPYNHLIRFSLPLLGLCAIGAFAITKRFSLVIDLIALTALSYLTPPLIAFAVYFGLWHAQRHTARLVPLLPNALSYANSGFRYKAIWCAVAPGMYAVAASFVTAGVLMVLSPGKFSSSLLWALLVIIWALTVPHMISTARLDRISLKRTFPPF